RSGGRGGADQIAAGEPWQIARLLFVGAEVDERQRADRRVRAERPAERGIGRDLLADVRRADQIESESAVGRWNLEPQQIELARLLEQLAREIPVVPVETVDTRKHFLLH